MFILWLINTRPDDWAVTKTLATTTHIPGGLVISTRRSHRHGPGSIPGVGICFLAPFVFLVFFKALVSSNYTKEYIVMYQSNRNLNIPPPRAYPGHLTPFLAWEGGSLITTHRGWGIWSLASMSCYELNHGGDGGDVKLWWIQRKKLRICGGLLENQRPTQAVFRIWRCLRTIYICSI